MAARPPSGDLREALVRAAEEELEAVGVGAVSLRAIARRAGVSHQAPGHVFRDRAGLFTAVAQEGYAALADALRSGYDAAGGADPITRLGGIGTAYVRFALERGAMFAVLTRPELLNLDDPALVAARARPFDVLDRGVRAAADDGWGDGRDPRTLALLCWTTMHGLATLARDGILAIDVPEAGPDELAALLSATLVDALRPGGATRRIAP
ncbi:MAG: TetR/AcrR family transcriptional regulator [Solirubrobacteraceae bacterium]